MKRFTLKELECIEAKQRIYKLEIDNSCQFEKFEQEISERKQYENEIASIYSLIEDVANNKLLPKTKFRDITITKKDKIKEYEFKTRNLRVYTIKSSEGKIIIIGGYKNNQKKDIKKFRKIKTEFIKHQKR
jgi:hypothetical protein